MIPYEWARNIAAWYQSPGTEGIRFAEFASAGVVKDPEGLIRDIVREQRTADVKHWFWLEKFKEYIMSVMD